MKQETRPVFPGRLASTVAAFRVPCSLQAALFVAMAGVAGAQAVQAAPAAPEQAPNRVMLMPRAGLPEAELARMLKPHGGSLRKVGQSSLYIVELPAQASAQAVAAQLAHHPHLKFAEADRAVPADLASNDPYMGSAWHLVKIGAPAAWDSSQGNGITVAVLDTGVDGSHPDLAARMVAGWNFYDNNSNSADVYGHGTKVAGAVAATTNNALGVAGVAGQARIMPLRISNASGTGYWSMVAQGLIWAADRGARLANVSYEVAGSSSVLNAAQYMKGKGGLVFVSAGNTGAAAATAPSTALIPVGATDANDARASFSTYGNFVALAAPGVSVYTTTNGGGYGAVSGTSFSSPVAAGVAALMMAARPALTGAQVESLLYKSALDLGTAGRDPYFGWGRVNAPAAVQAALTAATADTQPPTAAIAAPLAGATVSGLVAVNVNAADNVGVTRVELRVNGNTVAVDTAAPFGFIWDSAGTANGGATLSVAAFDAAGNSVVSSGVGVYVSNASATALAAAAADTTAPALSIVSPVAGDVAGTVAVGTEASDDSGAAGIRQSLYIDGELKASGPGANLAFSWNTRKSTAGLHVLTVVASDAAGNQVSRSVQVRTN
ncbi:S8 family serine peptidase [Azohydromonas aeria]|uniref:S8 family serine peptidase n=1 Tax=Azohydromonas aeria TaxID=2590212 RepID=UPI0012F9C5E6|nr:S8 family serine peptidase [Azohydromonas aeria]